MKCIFSFSFLMNVQLLNLVKYDAALTYEIISLEVVLLLFSYPLYGPLSHYLAYLQMLHVPEICII